MRSEGYLGRGKSGKGRDERETRTREGEQKGERHKRERRPLDERQTPTQQEGNGSSIHHKGSSSLFSCPPPLFQLTSTLPPPPSPSPPFSPSPPPTPSPTPFPPIPRYPRDLQPRNSPSLGLSRRRRQDAVPSSPFIAHVLSKAHAQGALNGKSSILRLGVWSILGASWWFLTCENGSGDGGEEDTEDAWVNAAPNSSEGCEYTLHIDMRPGGTFPVHLCSFFVFFI